MEKIKLNPGNFEYQLYFQEAERAAAELDRDPKLTLVAFQRTADEYIKEFKVKDVFKNGGLLTNVPKDLKPGKLLSDPKVLEHYVANYQSFFCPLRLYQNYDLNEVYRRETKDVVIEVPCLMMTAGNDPVLVPSMVSYMKKSVKNVKVVHFDKCSHWIMEEEPAKVSEEISKFYHSVINKSNM